MNQSRRLRWDREQGTFVPISTDPPSFQGNRNDNIGSNQVQRVQDIQSQRGGGHFDIKGGGNHGNMRENPIGSQNSLLGMPPHLGHQNSLLGMPPHLRYSVPCNLNFDRNPEGEREMRKGSAKTNVSRREKRQDRATQSQDPSASRPHSASSGKEEGHRYSKLNGQTKGSVDRQGTGRGCGRERDQCGRRGGNTNEQTDAEIYTRSSNVDAQAPVEERTERKPRKRRQRRKKAYDRRYEKAAEAAVGMSPQTAEDPSVSDTDDSTSSSSNSQNEGILQSNKAVDVLLSKFKDLGDQIAQLKVSKSDLLVDLPSRSSGSTKSSKLKSQEFKTSVDSLGEEKTLRKKSIQDPDNQMDIAVASDDLRCREPTEPPGEKEVFRYLIKEVGGPTCLENIAGKKLFPKDFDILSWFRDHQRRFILFENKEKNYQFIVPFYKEATFCFGYNNIGKYERCDQSSCPHAHICKNFVGGSCRQGQKCRFSHNFYDGANSGLILKLGLDIFSNEEIRLIYSQRFPHVCGNHSPTRSCHLPACAYLHICKRSLLGRCDRESDCPLGHTLETDQNKNVIKAYHLSHMKESLVKKVIFISTFTCKGNIQQKGRSARGSRESIKEEQNMSQSKLNKMAKSRSNFQKEQKSKPQSRSKSSNDRKGNSRSSASPAPERFRKDGIGSDDIFKRDLMNSRKEEAAKPSASKGDLQVEGMQVEEKPTINVPHPERTRYLEPKVANKDTYVEGAKPKGPRPRYRSSNEEETTSQDSVLETDAAQSTPICDLYLVDSCKMASCKCHHHQSIKLPYIWQIQMFNSWLTLDKLKMIEAERAYCNKASSYQTVVFFEGSNYIVTLEFHTPDTLTAVAVKDGGSSKFKIETSVRRLSTMSYAEGTKPSAEDSFKTQWRWFYTDDFGRWCLLEPELLQFTLEQKFTRKCQDTYLFCRENYRFKYRIDFTSMKQINMETGKERKLLRRPLFVSAEDMESKHYPEKIAIPTGVAIPLPKDWVPWDLAHAFELVELKQDSFEFKRVESLFFSTLPTHEFHTVYICRVQNMELWMAYDGQKKSMKVCLERAGETKEVDERNLFHGTGSLDTVRGICTNCFDFRLCGRHGTRYGKGAYFARDAKYSHSYTDDSNATADRYMFLAKVLVGEYTTGLSNYTRPPEKPGGTAHQLFDSCVDNVDNPSIFVAFDLKQCYPEYLICYKRLEEFPIVRPSKMSTPSRVTRIQPSPLQDQSTQPTSSIPMSSSSVEKHTVFAVSDPLQSPQPIQRESTFTDSFFDNISSSPVFSYSPPQSSQRSSDTSSSQTVYQREGHGVDDIGSRGNQASYSIRGPSMKQESCCIQ